MADPIQLTNIADALDNFAQAGKPADLAPKVQAYVQAQYDQLGKQGFWSAPANQSMGHSLRQSGMVDDPTQGGMAKPAQSTMGAPAQNYGPTPGRLTNPSGTASSAFVQTGTDQYGEPTKGTPAQSAARQRNLANIAAVQKNLNVNASPLAGIGKDLSAAVNNVPQQIQQYAQGLGNGMASLYQHVEAPLVNGVAHMATYLPRVIYRNLAGNKEGDAADAAVNQVAGSVNQFGRNVNKDAALIAAVPGQVGYAAGKTAVQSVDAVSHFVSGKNAQAAGNKTDAQANFNIATGDLGGIKQTAQAFADGVTGGDNGALSKTVQALYYLHDGQPALAKATADDVMNGIGKNAFEHPLQVAASVAMVGDGALGAAEHLAAGMEYRASLLTRAMDAAHAAGDTDAANAAFQKVSDLQQAAHNIRMKTEPARAALNPSTYMEGKAIAPSDATLNGPGVPPAATPIVAGLHGAPPEPIQAPAPAPVKMIAAAPMASGTLAVGAKPIPEPIPAKAPNVVLPATPSTQIKEIAKTAATNAPAPAQQKQGQQTPGLPALKPAEAPSVPPQEQSPGVDTAPPVAASTPKATAEYAGSVNLGTMGLDEAGKAKVRAAIEASGSSVPRYQSDADTVAKAQSMGVTLDGLREFYKKNAPGTPPGNTDIAAYGEALQQLHQKMKDQSIAADAVHEANPTPANLQSMIDANKNHADAAKFDSDYANGVGRALQLRAHQSTPFEAANTGDMFKPQAQTVSAAAFKTKPQTQGRLTSNKVFTADAVAAAQARVAAKTAPGIKGILSDESGHIDTDLLNDYVTIAGGYIEAGLRQFPAWAAKMTSDHPSLTPGDLQAVWNGAKLKIQNETGARQTPTVYDNFVDQYAKAHGRENANGFVSDLMDHSGDTSLLTKVLDGGKSLSDEDRRVVAAAETNNSRTANKGPLSPGRQALKEARDFVKQEGAATGQAKGTTGQAKGTPDPAKVLDGHFARRLGGPLKAAQLRTRIGEAIHQKLAQGQPLTEDESRQFGMGYQSTVTPRKPGVPTPLSKTLTETINSTKDAARQEIHNQKIGQWATRKTYVKDLILKDLNPKRIPDFTKAYARVRTNNNSDISELYQRYGKRAPGENVSHAMRGNFLSSVQSFGRIIPAHIAGHAVDEIGRGLAAPLSRGTIPGYDLAATGREIAAGVKAIPAAGKMFARGHNAVTLAGNNPMARHNEPLVNEFTLQSKLQALNIPATATNVAARIPMRTHSAVYHVLGSAIYDRGMSEAATLAARAHEAATGVKLPSAGRKAMEAHLRANPTAAMVEHAKAYHAEQMFTNPNVIADGLSSTIKKAGPAVGALASLELPFTKVPMNIQGRELEYAGLGAAKHGADYLFGKRDPYTDTQKATLAKSIARPVVAGAGGALTGYELYKHGILTAPDDQKGDPGSINIPKGVPVIGGRSYQIGRDGPLSAPVMASAQWAAAAKEYGGYQNIPASVKFQIAKRYASENPMTNLSGNFNDLTSGKPGAPQRVLNNQAAALVPQFLGNIAADRDPTRFKRQVTSPITAVENMLPQTPINQGFNRNQLPVRLDPLTAKGVPEQSGFSLLPKSAPTTSMTNAQRLDAAIKMTQEHYQALQPKTQADLDNKLRESKVLKIGKRFLGPYFGDQAQRGIGNGVPARADLTKADADEMIQILAKARAGKL